VLAVCPPISLQQKKDFGLEILKFRHPFDAVVKMWILVGDVPSGVDRSVRSRYLINGADQPEPKRSLEQRRERNLLCITDILCYSGTTVMIVVI
jgi:hypothetical protein